MNTVSLQKLSAKIAYNVNNFEIFSREDSQALVFLALTDFGLP